MMLCSRCMNATEVLDSREARKAGAGQRLAAKRAVGDLSTYVVRRRRCTALDCGQVFYSVEIAMASPPKRDP